MNRLALALALVLASAPLVVAQGNTTTNATNGTTTNATTPTDANATAPPTDNATTPTDANATDANATTPAGPPPPIEISLTGHDESGSFYWTVEGSTDHNPKLTVLPGQQVTFHVKAASGTHNFKVGDLKASKIFSEGDPIVDVIWTAPDTPGTITYLCTIHSGTMKGTIQVGTAAPSGGGGGAGEITGETVDLGTLGYADCAGTKIPAIVTRAVTGGPTLADYVKNCKGGATLEGKPASNADYVIPISLVLVGLGVVGVVWVHRAYKP